MIYKIVLMLLICSVLLMAGCQAAPQNNLTQELLLDFEVQYIRTNGYVDSVSYPIISLIHSSEELDAYYGANRDVYDLERRDTVYSDTTIGFLDAIDAYNDAYFSDSVLVFVVLEEGSGSVRHEVTRIERNENLVEILIKRIVPEEGTDDMAGWHILLELLQDSLGDSEIEIIFE